MGNQVQEACEMSIPRVTHQFADVQGVRVFYRSAGPEDAPALLLLHGFPSASHQFRRLIDALGTRYRVIAPDYPGFGHTQAPPGADRRPYCPERQRLPRGPVAPGPPDDRQPPRSPWRRRKRPADPGATRYPWAVRGGRPLTGADRPRRVDPRPALPRPAGPQGGADRPGAGLPQQRRALPGLAAVAARVSAARAYLRDLPDAEIHLFETGHFALEENLPEIAPLIAAFLDKIYSTHPNRKDPSLKIAVIGATGNLGGAVAREAA